MSSSASFQNILCEKELPLRQLPSKLVVFYQVINLLEMPVIMFNHPAYEGYFQLVPPLVCLSSCL
ncbi:hypothetical protein JK635_04580 [Neobacillus sp. YIM B02564]|uniref:Uncharacterized protein n=1 Tax=Neobacillus paridis TaxID=2803862 RepID=A0ABS1TJL3_9BACI|nr:hypothetical protein [Neobacillus paridis]